MNPVTKKIMQEKLVNPECPLVHNDSISDEVWIYVDDKLWRVYDNIFNQPVRHLKRELEWA